MAFKIPKSSPAYLIYKHLVNSMYGMSGHQVEIKIKYDSRVGKRYVTRVFDTIGRIYF